MQRCIIVLLPPLQSGSFIPFSHLLLPLKLSHVALEEHFEQSEIILNYALHVDINAYILKLHVTNRCRTMLFLLNFPVMGHKHVQETMMGYQAKLYTYKNIL